MSRLNDADPCDVAAKLASVVASLHPQRRVRVALDGLDGAGKTVLAAALVAALTPLREAVGAGLDGFHRRAAQRYARGRHDPVGFYRDSYDLEALRRLLLDPFSHDGDGVFRRAVHDVDTDAAVSTHREQAGPSAVLVVDGIFLQRPELDGCWGLVVWVDAPFEVTYRRMAERDGCHPDPEHPSNRRYRWGQQLYLDECDPAARADVVVDNGDPRRPPLRLRSREGQPRG